MLFNLASEGKRCVPFADGLLIGDTRYDRSPRRVVEWRGGLLELSGPIPFELCLWFGQWSDCSDYQIVRLFNLFSIDGFREIVLDANGVTDVDGKLIGQPTRDNDPVGIAGLWLRGFLWAKHVAKYMPIDGANG